MAIPTIHDYPRSLVPDGRAGEERRRTIDGMTVEATPDSGLPLVSIITIVYNSRRHVERAMQSVFIQSYRNIEYIVIDGGSTDGTVDIIRSHSDRLSYWHSAPDRGISDAFNMGVALAKGAYVGLVNSDDWMSENQVEEGVKALQSTNAPFVFGNLIYHDPVDGRAIYRIKGDPSYAPKLWHRMPQVTHPTALVRKGVYEQFGFFDLRWKIGMDYDWLLRLHQHRIYGTHVDRISGHMSLGGVSDKNWHKCLKEHYLIATNYGSSRLILTLLYTFRIFKISFRQFVERLLPEALAIRIRSLFNRSLIRTHISLTTHRHEQPKN